MIHTPFWAGLPVQPYSALGRAQSVKIDRCRVRYYEDAYGHGHYQTEGAHRDVNIWYPLGAPENDPHAAWAQKQETERAIETARNEYAEQERRRTTDGAEDRRPADAAADAL